MFEAEKEVVKRYVAMSQGTVETWEGNSNPYDLFADDIEYEITGRTPVSGVMRGRAEIAEKLSAPFWERLESVELFANEIVALEDGRVLFLGGSKGRAKNGRDYNQEYCYIFTVEAGKIKKILKYCDTALIETAIYGRDFA